MVVTNNVAKMPQKLVFVMIVLFFIVNNLSFESFTFLKFKKLKKLSLRSELKADARKK